MKKLYTLICTAVLLFAYTGMHAQVLVVEDFEDPNAVSVYDFPGWETGLPPFSPTSVDPCEGNQSIRSSEIFKTVAYPGYNISYLSQKTTGKDVKISFDYKIQDKTTGNPVSGKFGKIYLEYATNGKASPVTWTKYDSITKAPTATGCATHTYTIKAADLPTGSDFGWRMRVVWNTGSYFVYVDDFKAVEKVDCVQPVNAKIVPGSITFDEAKIVWEDLNAFVGNTATTTWEVLYCTASGGPGSPTCTSAFGGGSIMVTGKPEATIPGLDDGRDYWVYVRAVCGPTSNSNYTPAVTFQTIAIGSICSAPIEINQDPMNPDVSIDLPYNTDDKTATYADDVLPLEGSPGIGCGGGGNLLDGYEVVYHYNSAVDDILTIDVTQLTGSNVGVYVYNSCADIGTGCIGGAVTANGSDLNINDVQIKAGEEVYIVIASLNNQGQPANTDYHLRIKGFDCAKWDMPKHKTPMPFPFTAGQTLNKFGMNIPGSPYVLPTIGFATLQWYMGVDKNGNGINPIDPKDLNDIVIKPGDVFYVTQNIGLCESPVLKVTFAEFLCNNELGGITGTTEDFVCGSGQITLKATANTIDSSEIQWYDSKTGDGYLATGNMYTTPNIEETTSYWVTEVFLGITELEHQAHKGPTTYDDHQETPVGPNDTDYDYGIIIKPEQDFTLVDVTVYSTGGGNTMAVKLMEEDNENPIDVLAFPITVGTPTSPTANVLTLNWQLEAGKTYYLMHEDELGGNPSLLVDENPSFPYPVGTSGFVTSGGEFYKYSSGSSFRTDPTYYYFFDWTIVGNEVLCEKSPRTEVVATVHDIIPTKVSADDLQVCKGTSTKLHVTSTDKDYVYTWEWVDGPGDKHKDAGPDITVTPIESTTYTVTAVNPKTTCEFVNEIRVVVIGVEEGDLPVEPSVVETCQGEIVNLTAGGLKYDFNEGAPGWSQQNDSKDMNGKAVKSAAWKIVDSPYASIAGATSNDASQFMLASADSIGPEGTLATYLFSPPINLVGVSSASLSFYHYYKDRSAGFSSTQAYVMVSANGEPFVIDNALAKYGGSSNDIEDEGEPTNFVLETLDLSEYAGSSNVVIAFAFTGDWGWWWAIDNLTITRNYLNGSLTWTPKAGLFYDDAANIPYDGAPINTVYYYGDKAGATTYTATLTVTGCGGTTKGVKVTVYDTKAPTGPKEQDFNPGDALKDLTINNGKNLKWYIKDENGNYDQVSANTPLMDGETYYVSQTLNNCESGFLEITVSVVCPKPKNLEVTVSYGDNDKVEALVEWEAPTKNATNIETYRVVLDSLSTTVFETMVEEPFVIIDGLSKYTDYKINVYSVCSIADSAYSESIAHNFITLRDADFKFDGLSFYPNPTKGVVYFENQTPIQSIVVYDLTGRQVFNKEVFATRTPVDFSNLASGTYMVAITAGGAKRMVKIIKE